MKHTIKAVLIAALVAAFLTAAEPLKTTDTAKATVQKASPLSESQLLRIENISLKKALLEQQSKALSDEQNALVKDICSAAGIKIESCSIDPQSKSVREAPPVVAAK